jgi:hypothetical protein
MYGLLVVQAGLLRLWLPRRYFDLQKLHATLAPAHTAPSRPELLRTACAPAYLHSNSLFARGGCTALRVRHRCDTAAVRSTMRRTDPAPYVTVSPPYGVRAGYGPRISAQVPPHHLTKVHTPRSAAALLLPELKLCALAGPYIGIPTSYQKKKRT